MAIQNLTMADLDALGTQDAYIANFLRRLRADTYEEFLEVLLDDVKLVIETLEANPQNYPLDEEEDATTQRIVDILTGMNYAASHSKASGGNVDLTVELKRKFKWIAEAKKFGDVGDMREGFLQLSTRYTPTATSKGRAYGGLIGYIRRPKAAKHVGQWRKEFESGVGVGGSTSDCGRRGAFAFISELEHQVLGVPMEVWHTGVALYFDPLDKSGRTAQKYVDARTAGVLNGGA